MDERMIAPKRKRGVSVVVYDLQGGPLSEELILEVQETIESVVQNYEHVAYLMKVE